MRLPLFIIAFLVSTIAFSQKGKTANQIDSLLKNSSELQNYRYWYGSNEQSFSIIFDFRMDTTTGKISRFIFTSCGQDTISTNYFFIDNYLVKVNSFKINGAEKIKLGTYYFKENKVVYKAGRNVKLAGKGYFRKIAPKYFTRQLNYIYFQYEYLNPSKNRYNLNVPELLEIKRQEIDKRNSY